MISEPSSFRDNSAKIIYEDGIIKRLIHKDYVEQFNFFLKSGLYDRLRKEKLIIEHSLHGSNKYDEYPIVICPAIIPFISYAYEWSFSQLKSAALLTLRINKIALEYGMILKDSSSYNVQFVGVKPIFIDTSSFEIYKNNTPWKAYTQFCKHFYAPLVLAKYCETSLKKMLISNIDGIPLKLCRKLLPIRAYFDSGVFLHIFLNSIEGRIQNNSLKKEFKAIKISKNGLISTIDHLVKILEAYHKKPEATIWSDYYECTTYGYTGFSEKRDIINSFIKKIKPTIAIDIGSNSGRFSRVLSENDVYTISLDIDDVAVEKNFNQCTLDNIENILPLQGDITNPTPNIGWANLERKALIDRINVDLVMALAIVHHLVITFNISLRMIAKLFSTLGKHLVLEFPNENDEMVLLIANGKETRLMEYSKANLEMAFDEFFHLLDVSLVTENNRTIYLYESKKFN